MFLVQCSFRYSIVTNTFTICILNEPNIFTPYLNFRLTVCAGNDLGRPTFQSDSFLTHTLSLMQCNHSFSTITYTFIVYILDEPNIFTPYFIFRLTMCARNDLCRPTFQSDSFLMHTFSTDTSFFLLDETLIDILNSDNSLLTSYA